MKNIPEELTIHIQSTDQEEGGYMYDIYFCRPEDVEDNDSVDGGQCTSTLENAIDMAQAQAREAIARLCKNDS